MSDPALVFDRVGKSFGHYQAVRGISFTLERHELVCLLGPSGCGKTTTLRLVAGLEMPTSGTILIGGKDVSAIPASQRNIAMVFQSYALFPHMSVVENVAYGLIAQRIGKKEARERALAQLELVGLAGYDKRLPSEISGGQQQRVAVARALVLEPDVLLFDEPLSNLDAKLRRRVREDIRDLQQRLGLTVLYVTHDQSEAMAISDRIIIMQGGEIQQWGPPRALYEEPATAFVADFMGDANVIGATTEAGPDGAAIVPLDGLRLPSPLAAGQAVDVVLRPEHLVFTDAGEGTIRGTIRRASYLGAQCEYRVESALGPLLVIEHVGDTIRAEGAEIGLTIDPRRARIIARAGA
ncbi:ABC transporter ATP-binding protein [Acuticoccus kandeliae]|uniref:ABC transporter ATP-binding protein n=1 Tax=Acuticoccus kandeliae TaxID=2073160 RepID=UPI000D3E6837|nr:ABC transporter ATP-binding protein [Acuticoccus kandeliae]